MREFKYKVSVIIPIYNAEKYLEDCIASLLMQTLEQKYVEILLIDDGSSDNSLTICKEYAAYYDNVRVLSQENSGCSAARNLGIREAKGKYLMYLDSDDTLSPNALECVTAFFDAHYDEVDLVTYPIERYCKGVLMTPHFRYRFLRRSGVYDLQQYPFIGQTTMNVVVKNRFEDNLLFNSTMFYQEDQQYCCRILKEKMTIGFCADAKYLYNQTDTGAVGTQTHAFYIFEQSTKYFEDLFAQFEKVPPYFQALFIQDISWKLSQHVLFPFHYSPEEFEKAMGRIVALLKQVDVDVILNHPATDPFHRFYFLELRGKEDVTVMANRTNLSLLYKNRLLDCTRSIELILSKFSIRNGQLYFLAYIKSKAFNFTDTLPQVYAEITTATGTQRIPLELYLSADSYYKAKVVTNKFWSFCLECPVQDVQTVEFVVEIGGIAYPVHYYFMPRTPFNRLLKRTEYLCDDLLVQERDGRFYFERKNASERADIEDRLDRLSGDPRVRIRRKFAKKLASEQKIWLYYDCKGVAYDNGYLQFMHDVKQDDGVERYYISNNKFSQVKGYFPAELWERVIPFGSEEHKRLLIACEKLITAYIEEPNIYPFSAEERPLYTDLFRFEIVYLQHGILHAHLPWKYAPERIDSDKLVVSSYFEKKNFTEVYHFREKDLLPFGMPRFGSMEKEVASTNRILFAPSWRQYLVGENKATGEWIYTPEKFKKSHFFEKVQAFLNHPQLHALLEKHDLYLDFKLHPIMKPYQDCFTLTSDRVSFAESVVKDEEYAVFITDFSSFVFNFAYLKKPILYFVPDYAEFTSGMTQYRELDLPFEDAFGNLTQDAEGALDALSAIVERGCRPSATYLKRMEQFYLPMNDCCEDIYRALVAD